MESVLKSLFKRELKAILAPYSDIICALFIIAIIGYIIYYLYNKFNENKTKNNVNSIVNNSLKCSHWFCDFIYFTYSHWCYGRINIYLT